MFDQATRLREMAAAYQAQALATRRRRTRVVAVTSGKGGVGKSNLSVNLGHALIAAGQDVILFDADLGLANAEILMGATPSYHLGHLLSGEQDILGLIHHTPSRLKLIAGGSGLEELANLSAAQLRTFVTALQRLDGQADFLLLDTGAGLGSAVHEFVLAADQVILVTTPEPTALADGYGVIKTLTRRNPNLRVLLIINQAERSDEGERAAERMMVTARDFLGLQIEPLGIVPRDPHVWQAVRHQVPFFVQYPDAPASRAVAAIARRLLGDAAPIAKPKAQGFFERLAGLIGTRRGISG